MRKFLSALFKKISETLEKTDSQKDVFEKEETNTTSLLNKKSIETSREEEQRVSIEETQSVVNELSPPKVKEIRENTLQKKKAAVIHYPDKNLRDVIDLMEFPFVALSKDRINPLVYESKDKTQKVVISGHRGHFIASIYDWDIILIVAGKIQEILNKGSDIPSRKITIPRHELLKALHREGGKKQQKDLEKSLARLQLTGINTTINNKDGRYVEGFGFIESWRYAERKSDREIKIIQITLSEWLYELCCAQGSLLKSNSLYFDITSGLKKFLYRTARKHAGNNEDGWRFSIETLYEKSGSEGSFKLFKSKLKKVVFENDIPDYSMEWVDKNGESFVIFKKSKIHEMDRLAENFEKTTKL